MSQALNDPNTYLQIAQAAAQRGTPMQGNPQTPAPQMEPWMAQLMQGLKQIVPNLDPQQAQAIGQLVMQIMQSQEKSEPGEIPHQGGM